MAAQQRLLVPEHGPHVGSWLGFQCRTGCSQDFYVDLEEEWKDRGEIPGSKGENERRGRREEGRREEEGGGEEEGGREEGRKQAASSQQLQ